MKSLRIPTLAEIREMARLYVDERLSTYTIAGRMNVSPETVRARLVSQGVAMRTGAAAQRQNMVEREGERV